MTLDLEVPVENKVNQASKDVKVHPDLLDHL